ncbi:hypothetical protein DAD186_14090 [Dermabacter vaginalis]|uniref:M23ase beta-sheet core domain-containing protein n=1 Tax=Dermabacter vaginalis TaxID=1630135 RepID=A0A1B0ZIY3_9MICO|nr:hypothetical protein DAD186_14090 [Dermabacter vaginalis]
MLGGAAGVAFVLFLAVALLIGVLGIGLISGVVGGMSTARQESTCAPSGDAVAVSVKEGALPTGVEGLSDQQIAVAAVIMKVGAELGMGERGQLIALMTAAQESDLGADPTATTPDSNHDAGPFQQRVLPGWYGTLEQVNDPAYSARVFFEGRTVKENVPGAAGPVGYHIPGLKNIKNWQSMPLTKAAQSVQVSAFPNAYAKHENRMRRVMNALGDVSGVEVSFEASGQTECDGLDVAEEATTEVVPGSVAQSGFRHPTKEGTPITSPFGYRNHPTLHKRKFHEGIDLGNTCGTPVYAVQDGVVDHAGPKGSASGNAVVLNHEGGVVTRYYHLSAWTVKKGQTVKRGQRIGSVGTTGRSTGCHLHFGVEVNGALANPANWIPK